MAQTVSRRPPTAEARFDPGSVHVGFVVDKVALDRFFPEYFGSPLSISFHRCSITRKRTKNNHNLNLHHRVAQEASRLQCVRSVCCGPLTTKKNNRSYYCVNGRRSPQMGRAWFQYQAATSRHWTETTQWNRTKVGYVLSETAAIRASPQLKRVGIK
jgi:hypothetical protein